MAEAHTSLAFILAFSEYNWSGADREFARALELNPDNLIAHYWWALTQTISGRGIEAETHIQRALELEPLSPLAGHAAAMSALYDGRREEALQRATAGIAANPEFFISYVWLGIANLIAGAFDEAIRSFETARDITSGKHSWVVGALGHGLALRGRKEEARAILTEWKDRANREPIDPTALALVHDGLGEAADALAWLEKGVETRGMLIVLFPRVPRFARLRAHPRGQAILRRLNLLEETKQ